MSLKSIDLSLQFYLPCNGENPQVVPLKKNFQIPQDSIGSSSLKDEIKRNFQIEQEIGLLFFSDFQIDQLNPSPFLPENYVATEKDNGKTLCVFRRICNSGESPRQLTTEFYGNFAENNFKMQTFLNSITLGFMVFYLKKMQERPKRFFQKSNEPQDVILFFQNKNSNFYYKELSEVLDPSITLTYVFSVNELIQTFSKREESLCELVSQTAVTSGVTLHSYYSIPGIQSFKIDQQVFNDPKKFNTILSQVCATINSIMADPLGTSSAIVKFFEKDQETPFHQLAVTIKAYGFKTYAAENETVSFHLKETLGKNFEKLNKIELHCTPEKICVHCSENTGTTRCEFNAFCLNYICESANCKLSMNDLPICQNHRNHNFIYSYPPEKKIVTLTIKYYTGFIFGRINVVSRTITVPVNTNIREYLLKEMRNEEPGHVGHQDSWAVWRNTSLANNYHGVNFKHYNLQLMFQENIEISNPDPSTSPNTVTFPALSITYLISAQDNNKTLCVFRGKKTDQHTNDTSNSPPHFVEFPQHEKLNAFFKGGSTFGHVFHYLVKKLFQNDPSEFYKYLVLLEKNEELFYFPRYFSTFKMSKFIFPVVTKIHLYALPAMTKQMNQQPAMAISPDLCFGTKPTLKLNISFGHPLFDTKVSELLRDPDIVEKDINFCHQVVEEPLLQCAVSKDVTVSQVLTAIKNNTDLFQRKPWLNAIQCVVSNFKVLLPWNFNSSNFTVPHYNPSQSEISVLLLPFLVCQKCNTQDHVEIPGNRRCVTNPFLCNMNALHVHKENFLLCPKCTYFHTSKKAFCCHECLLKNMNLTTGIRTNTSSLQYSKLGPNRKIMKKNHVYTTCQQYIKAQIKNC